MPGSTSCRRTEHEISRHRLERPISSNPQDSLRIGGDAVASAGQAEPPAGASAGSAGPTPTCCRRSAGPTPTCCRRSAGPTPTCCRRTEHEISRHRFKRLISSNPRASPRIIGRRCRHFSEPLRPRRGHPLPGGGFYRHDAKAPLKGELSLSKKVLTSWWTGKQAPRPGAAPQIYDLSRRQFRQGRNLKTQRVFSLPATPSGFCLNPADSGRKNCRETIFALENRIFRRKNPPVPAVHAAGDDGCSRGIRPSRALQGFSIVCAGVPSERRERPISVP